MASIRIVDVWLRSPVSPPTAWRSVMVIADAWAEQRVLMRAYASSADQTRPTIVLHGAELAIGPASADANGPWGIHVEPPQDGRAQELREQLQLAAKRLAGSKGTPPRLEDEAPAFERKRTNNWDPGAPRDEPDSPRQRAQAPYFEPAVAASQAHLPPQAPSSPALPSLPVSRPAALPADAPTMTPHLVGDDRLAPIRAAGGQAEVRAGHAVAHPSSGSSGRLPRNGGQRGWTSPVKALAPEVDKPVGSTTAMGFTSGAGAQTPAMRLGLNVAATRRLHDLVKDPVSPSFRLGAAERTVLNALAEVEALTASRIGAMVGVDDAIGWMEQLIGKLAEQGLTLVIAGPPDGDEPTYRLRR